MIRQRTLKLTRLDPTGMGLESYELTFESTDENDMRVDRFLLEIDGHKYYVTHNGLYVFEVT